MTEAFCRVIEQIASLATDAQFEVEITRSRLRNQADFYSLFGAVHELQEKGAVPPANIACERLLDFLEKVGNQRIWSENPDAAAYYQAARSASNDPGPRRVRIDIMKEVLDG